jgi:hypothetical protein
MQCAPGAASRHITYGLVFVVAGSGVKNKVLILLVLCAFEHTVRPSDKFTLFMLLTNVPAVRPSLSLTVTTWHTRGLKGTGRQTKDNNFSLGPLNLDPSHQPTPLHTRPFRRIHEYQCCRSLSACPSYFACTELSCLLRLESEQTLGGRSRSIPLHFQWEVHQRFVSDI